MKIAVYTIALNEKQFVKRWYKSAKEADHLLIADTGSTDGTIEYARELGINVIPISIRPWRFDDARNASLALLPDDIDYCISLDMDEILVEGWRSHLEKLDRTVTRPRYKYVWSWNGPNEGLTYGGDKIHTRHGYRWKHPVHETLVPTNGEHQEWCDLQIHHHPDNTKSRAQYFPLLKVARDESPHDDRTAFYYARELFFHGQYEEAITEFKRHLSLPTATWGPERAASMRYIAKAGETPHDWFFKAALEAPHMREPWMDLAMLAYNEGNWQELLRYCERALAITEQSLEYLVEPECWGARPYDLLSIAYWNLGMVPEALASCKKAINLDMDDPRLQENYQKMLLANINEAQSVGTEGA